MNVKKNDREKAKEIYLEHDGKIPLVDIAEQIGRPPGTVRGWKSKDNWDDYLSGTLQDKMERSKTTEQSKTKKKKQKKTVAKKIIKEVVANEELTDKQQLFCIYYLKYFNATKAYQKAYGTNYDTSMRAGHRLLRNVEIKQQIEKLKAERMHGIYLDGKDILQKYIDIAFADITDYVEFGQEDIVLKDDAGNPLLDKNGEEITILRNYVNFKSSDEVDGTIISEVSKGKDGVKIKLQDKMKALDFLSKHIGLLSAQDQVKIETEKTKTQKLQLEIEKIEGDDNTQAAEIWVENLLKLYEEEGNKDGQRTH